MKGFLFDYGATLDTRGEHWSKVIWRAYERHHVPITWEDFWEAYVTTERKLGEGGIILPSDTFYNTLSKKIALQLQSIKIKLGTETSDTLAKQLTDDLYDETLRVIAESKEVLQEIADKYRCPMVLVSNFYGNIHTVLREMGLDRYFAEVIESAEVGIRKPDPRIWQLAIEALGRHSPTPLLPQDITVVGDSLEKDIIPAQALGCKTIHVTEGLRFEV